MKKLFFYQIKHDTKDRPRFMIVWKCHFFTYIFNNLPPEALLVKHRGDIDDDFFGLWPLHVGFDVKRVHYDFVGLDQGMPGFDWRFTLWRGDGRITGVMLQVFTPITTYID